VTTKARTRTTAGVRERRTPPSRETELRAAVDAQLRGVVKSMRSAADIELRGPVERPEDAQDLQWSITASTGFDPEHGSFPDAMLVIVRAASEAEALRKAYNVTSREFFRVQEVRELDTVR